MKHTKITNAFLVTLVVVALTFRANAQMADLQKFNSNYINGIEEGDASTLSNLYANDAFIRNIDGSMVSGLDEIKQQYEAFYSSGKHKLTLKNKEETTLDKKHLFVSGNYELTQLDGEKTVTKGEYVNVLKKVKGEWKIYKSYRYPAAINAGMSMQASEDSSNSENVQVVDATYKAFAKGDIPTVLGLLDEKVVWNEAEGNTLADGNPYIGPDAVLNGVFARIPNDFENFRLVDIKLHEMSNNQVLATLRYNGKSVHNGKELDAQVAHLWTVKDGKVMAFQQYVDTKQLDEMMNK